jgi:hypothetical protein
MWRRLLRRVHPDHGGDGDLFIWAKHLFDHVAGDSFATEDERTSYQRRQPPPHPPHSGAGERLDFTGAYRHASFADLTQYAVCLAETVPEPYAPLLRMLASCYAVPESDTTLYRAQHQGATYKQLAYVAHLAGMSKAQRTEWYRVAQSVPLSQAHAGHLIRELRARAA